MKCAGYIRVSTDEAAQHGHSLDAQRQAIVSYARQRDWEVIEIYEDAGISGTRSDRPDLERLLRDAAQGRTVPCGTARCFDVVIVHAIDRFYRNLQGLLKALNHLHKHDAAFISIVENMDFTTPWGKLALAVLGTLAEIYIDRLSAETRKGKKQRARKGLYNGSIPLGYCKGNCSECSDPNGESYCPRFGGPDINADPQCPLVLHPIDSVAVRLAFEWYAAGDLSDGDVAEKLNDCRHRLPDGTVIRFRSRGRNGRSKPSVFCKDSVRSLLKRVFYTGVVPYYGTDSSGRKKKKPTEIFDGRHPAIVDQELFDRCRELRQLTGKASRSRRFNRCARCGGSMRAQSINSGVRYYRCTTRTQRKGDCPQLMVRADEIEEQVAQVLAQIKLPSDWREHIPPLIHSTEELETKHQEEEALRQRMNRLTELYLQGDISRERYEQEKAELLERLTSLTFVGKSAILSAAKSLEDFEATWTEASQLKRKKLLRGLVAVASVRGDSLQKVHLSSAAYPLAQLSMRQCLSGSDGPRSISKTHVELVPPSSGPIL